jgi:hypothetical protein
MITIIKDKVCQKTKMYLIMQSKIVKIHCQLKNNYNKLE